MSGRGAGLPVADDGGVVIGGPAELVASLPAMLGFVPGDDSVAAVCGRRTEPWRGPVLRIDAPGLFGPRRVSDDEEIPLDSAPAQFLAEYCEREGYDEVHLVLVHRDSVDDPEAALRARDAAEALEFWMGSAGVTIESVVTVGRIAAGERWADLATDEAGEQIDPMSTELAARNAVRGRVCEGTREEIDELYRERDNDACEEEQPESAHRRTARGRRAALRLHDELARRFARGGPVGDDELARLGAALRDVHVRDALLSEVAERPLGDGDGRRDLWWALARRRPPTERSAALTLLGAAHYLAGGGVHAWSALAEAADADEGNGLAPLLLTALAHGVDPGRIRATAMAPTPGFSDARSGRGRRGGR